MAAAAVASAEVQLQAAKEEQERVEEQAKAYDLDQRRIDARVQA